MAFWDQYATPALLPNVAGSPNVMPGLLVGDYAYVGVAPGVSAVCQDATIGAAVWAYTVAVGVEGVATVDFGAFPGGTDASVSVTGQSTVLNGDAPTAWVRAAATPEHSVDEHRVEPITVTVGVPTPGVGFTIYANAPGRRLYGRWSIGWSY